LFARDNLAELLVTGQYPIQRRQLSNGGRPKRRVLMLADKAAKPFA
jgi:hypothetical protein